MEFEEHLPLHFASFMGDINTVRELIKGKATTSAQCDEDGINSASATPLFDTNNSQSLINFNNSSDSSEVTESSYLDKDQTEQTFLRVSQSTAAVDAYGCTALHEAARSGHAEIIALLVEEGGCDPHARCYSLRTPLHEACKFGHFSGAQMLMERFKSNPRVTDERGRDALHYAAANGRTELVNFLLNSEMTNNENNKCCPTTTDRRGNTALHLAAARGHFDVVKTLLTRSTFNVAQNENDDLFVPCSPTAEARLRVTPIHLAAANGHTETLRLLIETALYDISSNQEAKPNPQHMVDILNRKDTLGRTPFFMAACGDWEETMHLLKNLGCDQHVADNKGRCPNA